MTAAEFAKLIDRAVCSQDVAWTGRCPAHEDARSSLSWRDKDEKVLVHCHAGCSTKDVVAAVGKTMSDLFHEKEMRKPPPGALTVEALAAKKGISYELLKVGFRLSRAGDGVKIPYHLMDGSLSKQYQIRYADGSMKFPKGCKVTEPYGSPNRAQARKAGYVVIVEGPSDVWSGYTRKIPCLGIPSASMARATLRAEHLDGVPKVYIWKEPDKGGDHLVHSLSAWLPTIYRGDAFVMEPPPGVKDLNDLHLKYHPDSAEFMEQLQSMIRLAVPLEPPQEIEPPAESGKGYHLTGFGNRDRLVDAYGGDMAFAHGLNYLNWDGRRWKQDHEDLLVRERAVAVVKSLYAEAAALKDVDPDLATRIEGWAHGCEHRAEVNEMVDMARGPLLRDATEFDAKPMLFNAANGTIDLTTGALRPPARADLLTLASPVTYDPAAEAPTWERFIREITLERKDIGAYLQRLVGYILTGENKEHAFIIFHGGGENGKSTFLEVIRALLGPEYARQTQAATFLHKKVDSGSAPSPDIARLRGARLVTAVEPDKGRKLAEGLVKSLTGGDTVTGRHLYSAPIEFASTHKIIVACNHKPVVSSAGHAMWRRLQLVPFDASFEGRADTEMPRKLAAELPGILNWALKGCLAWQANPNGLDQPEEVRAATRLYREEQDDLGDFFSDRRVAFGPRLSIPAPMLYTAYESWAANNVVDKRSILSKKAFTQALGERGIQPPAWERFDGTPVRVYHGIGFVAVVADVAGKTESQKTHEGERMPEKASAQESGVSEKPATTATTATGSPTKVDLGSYYTAEILRIRMLKALDRPPSGKPFEAKGDPSGHGIGDRRQLFRSDDPQMAERLERAHPEGRGEPPADTADPDDAANDLEETVRQLPDYCPHGNPRLNCQDCCKHGMLPHRCISCRQTKERS